jgi:hypothetical protein
MRTLTMLAVVALIASVAYADETDRARRVKVALALGFAEQPKVDPAACERCSSLDDARLIAFKEGKPLVVFVGGCGGRGEEMPASVVTARADRYTTDGKPEAEKRIVVLTPGVDSSDGKTYLYVRATLSPNATAKEITAVTKVNPVPTPPKPPTAPMLNWEVRQTLPMYTGIGGGKFTGHLGGFTFGGEISRG